VSNQWIKVPFVLCIHIRAVLQQQMADFMVAFLNGEMQRSLIAESTYQKESIECYILDETIQTITRKWLALVVLRPRFRTVLKQPAAYFNVAKLSR
jgi:hypothetical protein